MIKTAGLPITAVPWQQSLISKLGEYAQRQWLRIILLFTCGVCVRVPALGGQLIWDDQYLAHDNPFMKSPLLILEAFRHYLFPESFSSHYRPVQHISYCLDYLLWKTDAYGYHLSNILWHVGSGILLYLLLQQLLRPLGERWLDKKGSMLGRERGLLSGAAFLVALLWIVHPVHSAAVDYISGRADSLAFFFACGGWLLYLRAQAIKSLRLRAILYPLAAISALLALCSRESACIWVLIFLLHLFTLDKNSTLRGKCVVLAVCLCVVGVYAGLRQLPAARPRSAGSSGSPAAVRVVLMLRALGDYGRMMAFPGNLHMERTVEAPEASLGNAGWRHAIASEYLSIGGLFVVAGLLYGSCRKGRAQPIRAFGAGWFILGYLPISNLIELNATIAEHWLYLPSVGLLLFVVGCCLEFPVRTHKFVLAAACFAIVGLGARSFVRSGDWLSPEMFYRHSLAAGATKIRIALNLGQIYTDKGDYAKAEPLLRKVLAMDPEYPIARNALAHLLFRQGKTKEAEELFAAANKSAEQSRNEYPRTWIAALNLARMCYRDDDLARAFAVLEKGRRDYPGTWELISYESELLRKTKGPDAALPAVQDFARENWWHLGASIALGKLYSEKGDIAQAEAAFRHASWLDVYDVEALNLIALIDVRQNRLDDAWKIQRRAVARQPDQPRQYLILSDILGKMGRSDEARAALAQVSRMKATADASAALN